MRIKFTKSSVLWVLVALLNVCALSAHAQTPAVDTDSWVRFPMKPKANNAVTSSATTPTPVAEPLSSTTPANPPSARANAEVPLQTAEPANDNAHEGWIQFPMRSRAPVASARASEPKNTLPQTTSTPTAPTTPEVAQKPESPPEQVKTPSVKIAGFVVTGNQSISTDQVLKALQPAKGQVVSNESLHEVNDLVSELYRQNGKLALVELPEQDLTNGVLRIEVTESHFAGVVLEDPQKRLENNPHLPEKMVEQQMPKGQVLSLEQLDHAAALMNDLPGMNISLSLKPGEKPGETQAVAFVEPTQKVQGEALLDNAGAAATGTVRESAKLTVNDPLKIGDAATVQMLHSEGLEYEKMAYSIPVGSQGWRLGASASAMNYQVVSSELQYLNARGPSATQGLDLTIPLLRAPQQNVTLQLATDKRQYQNEALDVVQSNYKGSTNSAYLETVSKSQDGSETTASAQMVLGNIDMSGSTAQQQSDDALTTQTAGDYKKLKFALMHKEPLDTTHSLVVSAQSQWADKNLDSSEKIFLGGAQGVRAYPTNEAGGSEGEILSLEWQKYFMAYDRPWTASSFYDIGHVVVNKSNNFPTASPLNDYTLKGVGFWVGATEKNRFGNLSLRFTVAHRLGINPGASSSTGLDQDGTHELTRYWLSLTQTF